MGIVRLELSEPLWYWCNHLSEQWNPWHPASKLSERSNGRGAPKGVARASCRERKREFVVPPPLTASPFSRAFAFHSKWKGFSQSITFLGNCARVRYSVSQFTSDTFGRANSIWIRIRVDVEMFESGRKKLRIQKYPDTCTHVRYVWTGSKAVPWV